MPPKPCLSEKICSAIEVKVLYPSPLPQGKMSSDPAGGDIGRSDCCFHRSPSLLKQTILFLLSEVNDILNAQGKGNRKTNLTAKKGVQGRQTVF